MVEEKGRGGRAGRRGCVYRTWRIRHSCLYVSLTVGLEVVVMSSSRLRSSALRATSSVVLRKTQPQKRRNPPRVTMPRGEKGEGKEVK